MLADDKALHFRIEHATRTSRQQYSRAAVLNLEIKAFDPWSQNLSLPLRKKYRRLPIHLQQLILQGSAALAIFVMFSTYFRINDAPLPWPLTAFAVGGLAWLLAYFSRQAWWWQIIHALFTPLIYCTSTLAITPGWFLLAFFLLLLSYRGALSGRIPLYFSNQASAAALTDLLVERSGARFLDLGAGVGSMVMPLSKSQGEVFCTGVENAPAAWLLGYFRTLGAPRCRWLWGDFWRVNLADYDVVYAFLSPEPMSRLWEKVCREMPPGSVVISNSFAVPGVAPGYVIEIEDARQTRLFCYPR